MMADNFTLHGVPVKIVQLENQKWEAKVGATTSTFATFNSKPGIDEIKKLVELPKLTRVYAGN
jgi:hypothetical protein